jgi:hypothetical protein
MTGKMPGHEVLLGAARAITGAQLGRLTEDERHNLDVELKLQVAARRNDFIPDEVRTEVVTEVLRAVVALGDHVGECFLVDFLLSNLGMEGLREALATLDESWVIFTCGNSDCGCLEVCTKPMFERVVANVQRVNKSRPPSFLNFLFDSQAIPLPRIIWEKPIPKTPDGGEKTDPLEEDESCPACGGSGGDDDCCDHCDGSGSKKDFRVPPS